MKRMVILPIIVIGSVLVSCAKEDFSKVIETSSEIEGRYDCISADWLGPYVDLNNDGQKSCNLMDEFAGMSNSMLALGKNSLVITGVEETDRYGYVSISFPVQYLRKNHSDGKISFANPLGGKAWYVIRFTIDQEGEIDWIEPDSIRDPESYVIDEGHHYDGIDYLKTGAAHVRYVIDGTICILFDVTYYDWASESWTSGKAEIRYQRRSPLYYD